MEKIKKDNYDPKLHVIVAEDQDFYTVERICIECSQILSKGNKGFDIYRCPNHSAICLECGKEIPVYTFSYCTECWES